MQLVKYKIKATGRYAAEDFFAEKIYEAPESTFHVDTLTPLFNDFFKTFGIEKRVVEGDPVYGGFGWTDYFIEGQHHKTHPVDVSYSGEYIETVRA